MNYINIKKQKLKKYGAYLFGKFGISYCTAVVMMPEPLELRLEHNGKSYNGRPH